jgi:hypothetical protein
MSRLRAAAAYLDLSLFAVGGVLPAQLPPWLDRGLGLGRAEFGSAPRWLFFRLAVLVTLVLWLADLYLEDLGQPGHAVAVLLVMEPGR